MVRICEPYEGRDEQTGRGRMEGLYVVRRASTIRDQSHLQRPRVALCSAVGNAPSQAEDKRGAPISCAFVPVKSVQSL